MPKHPRPTSKRARKIARRRAAKRVSVMRRILAMDPWGSRRN